MKPGMYMEKVDYDRELYKNYQRGRALSDETIRRWMAAISRHIHKLRGFTVLDLGSGTGRFSPHLAKYFHACVIGVEPSDKMRGIAENSNTDSRVSYIKGVAERIPVGDERCDFAFLSMAIHHFDDMVLGCRELYRVLKPDGLVFIRNGFKGRMERAKYHEFFPSAWEIDNRNLPSVDEVDASFSANGFEKVATERIVQQMNDSLQAYYERIMSRSMSTFEFMSDEEFQAGLLAMKKAAENEKQPSPVTEAFDLLVFKKCQSRGFLFGHG